MEHDTTKEERILHAAARLNLQIKVAYNKKHKVSQAARIKLFLIPQTRRIRYEIKTNERCLGLVDVVVSNRQGQHNKLHKSLRRITNYYVIKETKIKFKKSAQAGLFESSTYLQNKIGSYYDQIERMERNSDTNKKAIPDNFQLQKIDTNNLKL